MVGKNNTNTPKSNKSLASSERRGRVDGGVSNESDKSQYSYNNELPSVAFDNLRHAENEASIKSNNGDTSDLSVADEETNANGFYTGTGKAEGKGEGSGKGFFKRKGPMAVIISLIFGIGGMSFISVSSELVAWKENIYSMFGQNSAIISRRSNTVMRRLLSTNRSTTSDNIFGNTKFKISSSLNKKLDAEGIYYKEVDDADGKPLRLLLYEDDNGRYIPIVASDNDVPRAKAIAGMEIEIDGIGKVKLSDNSMSLTQARKVNKNFDTSYDTATLTFTGKIAGWFDNVVDSMYDRIIGRRARNQMDIDDADEEKVNKALLGNASDGVGDSDVDFEINGKKYNLNDFEPVENEDGVIVKYAHKTNGKIDVEIDADTYVKTYRDLMSSDALPVTKSSQPADTDSTSSALTAKAKKAAMTSTSIGCAFLKGIGAISATVGAIQTLNVINYASKYLELADKIKYGDADETVNLAMNNLNEKVKTTLYDVDGNEVEVEGSVTEGAGWNAPFAQTNIVDENDPSSLFVNRELANKNALRVAIKDSSILSSIPGLASVVGAVASFGASITAFRACNALQGIAGTVSFIADVVALFTFGISKVVKDAIKAGIEGAALAGAMIIITSVVSAITPTVAHWFAGSLTSAFLGKTGGFSLLSGSQNIMNSNLQMSTGRYADNKNAVEVFALTKDVEREWAAYERATKSPFDITSKYTFLGALYNSVLPIINMSGGKTVSTVSSVADLVRTSAVSLVSPSVSAANETENYAVSLASEGNCSYLSAVGVAGDFACNKYSGAYVNEIETVAPETIYEKMVSYDSFDGEDEVGNPKVNVKSDYAKYIVACVSSDTQPGTMNAAVQGFLTGIEKDLYGDSLVASGMVNFGRNFIPFEGFLDAVEAGEEEMNVKWNSGLACTGNTDDASFNEKIKNFSMYNLDQRVLYNMGVIETNSTVSFLEDYYEKNPLDYSYEGQIARVSGLTKEEVNDTLGLIEYYNFIAQYDASERYAFGAPVMEESHKLLFDNENAVAENYYVLTNDILYADIRNRVALV